MCYPLLPQWKYSLKLVCTPRVCVKRSDSCYPNMSVYHKASCDVTDCLDFSIFKCHNKCPMGLRTGDCGGKFMTVRTHCTSLVFSSCAQALGCVWAHYPVAVWILLHIGSNQTLEHVSEEWSGASPSSGWSQFSTGVQLQRKQNSSTSMFRCGFETLFFSLCTPFCFCHSSKTLVHQ